VTRSINRWRSVAVDCAKRKSLFIPELYYSAALLRMKVMTSNPIAVTTCWNTTPRINLHSSNLIIPSSQPRIFPHLPAKRGPAVISKPLPASQSSKGAVPLTTVENGSILKTDMKPTTSKRGRRCNEDQGLGRASIHN